MVDRYAKFATENLVAAAARIESDRGGGSPDPKSGSVLNRTKSEAKEKDKTVGNVIFTSRFPHVGKKMA